MESLLIPRTRPPLHLLPRIGRSRIRSSSGGGSRASTIATARTITSTAPAWLAAAVLFASLAAPSPALDPRYDVPQTLSGEDKKGARIQRPKSRLAERCVGKCVTTCILGGAGSPGAEGPLNVRRPLVVFKNGFRSRQYCLLECSDICNLIKDGEDGP
ncbi:uncharacterized protein LOC121985567 isoform X2 [Zingiber officinale]|uniref:Uncharacterized protein n=1 Tax=Zingiber officinale TaxID=94328 RepID=A0A8J5GJ72_ZINOF|nr:uncharacterized protein LOC121985567 isoform X2 [Zingiber officinale]KAG6504814.1 hypothetical protein ZIOFF_037162 [Zingiber officinale]